jgi:hypothetical protein
MNKLECRWGAILASKRRWLGQIPLHIAAVAALLLSGCAATREAFHDPIFGPSYQPENFRVRAAAVPDEFRRLAVLPLAIDGSGAQMESGREVLEPVLREEIGKQRRFELVFVTRDQLKQWTGKEIWTAEEPLPQDFFERLREVFDCDVVLFSRLTQFRPYNPPAIGWNFKLINSRKPEIWWAVDEVFDGGQEKVSNGARRYYQAQVKRPSELADSRSILQSPRLFGQYTVAAAWATLPPRVQPENSPKVITTAADKTVRTKHQTLTPATDGRK